jgi:serine phosphatase RsbU (regulator of sigma subunit)
MMFGNEKGRDSDLGMGGSNHSPGSGHTRFARDLFCGRFRAGQSLQMDWTATEYGICPESVVTIFGQFEALGLLTREDDRTATINPPNPKAMQDAYEVRAALEEIAGRASAPLMNGDVREPVAILEAMRSALNEGNLDACIEHDISFHKSILRASKNEALLRVWDTLSLDLRMSAVVGRLTQDMHEVVESHQPIIDALRTGRGRQAGLLLRNHVEISSEYIKKSRTDSGLQKIIDNDLQGAKDVQRAFFPPRTLSIPNLFCESYYQPVQEIGGDYYDFLCLQGGTWGIAIGDVSGKGISAAMVMAGLQASLRAQALHPHLDLSALIEDLNRLFFESLPAHFFASLFYGEYDPTTRILKYVNAGHNAPLVVRTSKGPCEIFRLDPNGIPIGISLSSQYPFASFQLEVGDLLVAYTDGITETENRFGEFWGEGSLESLLRSCSRETPHKVIEQFLEEVSTFAEGQPQRDDMTLVVISVQDGGTTA